MAQRWILHQTRIIEAPYIIIFGVKINGLKVVSLAKSLGMCEGQKQCCRGSLTWIRRCEAQHLCYRSLIIIFIKEKMINLQSKWRISALVAGGELGRAPPSPWAEARGTRHCAGADEGWSRAVTDRWPNWRIGHKFEICTSQKELQLRWCRPKCWLAKG